jgi:hypothetical protein
MKFPKDSKRTLKEPADYGKIQYVLHHNFLENLEKTKF